MTRSTTFRAAAAVAVALLAGLAGLGLGYVLFSGDDSPGDSARSPGTTATAGSASLDRCDHDDTSGCAPGAELVIEDDQWRCRQPLAEIATELGGTLPLKVTARFTTYVETSGPVIDLREGCVGDGSEAIDLILDVQGDGRTVGGVNDGVSVKLDARDLDITGNIDCGPRLSGSHQDGIQGQGGSNIAFVDLEIGDWEEERATCTGATGGIDISMGGVAGVLPTDYKCIRCRVVACRRGISIGESLRAQVTDSGFRSSNPAEREEELATGVIGLCNFGLTACLVDPTAREVVFEGNVCEEHPYEEQAPDGAPARAP